VIPGRKQPGITRPSVFIREAKGEKGFGIKGNPEKKSRVAFYANPSRPKAGERCVILSLTNLALFEHALGLRRTGIPFSLQGKISGIPGRISVDVYCCQKGHAKRSGTPSFGLLKTWRTWKHKPKDLDEFEFANMVEAVREYARILPDAVFDIIKISKSTAPRRPTAQTSSSPRSTGSRARNRTGSISLPTSRNRSPDRRPS